MRDETGEPEEHCDRLDAQDRERMRDPRKETRRDSEEGDDEGGGPDSDEDQEVDAVRGGVAGVSVPP